MVPIRSVDMGKIEIAEIELFPNPTTEFINITNVKGKGMIYNLAGQLEMEINLEEEGINSIDVRKLEQGVYHLYLQNENGKRVIERFSKISNK